MVPIRVLALAVVGIAVYAFGLSAGFVFDDYQMIVDNPFIRHPAHISELWQMDPSRFLTHLTFALNYHFNQLDVRPFHGVNIALHIFCSIVVYQLALDVLGISGRENFDSRQTEHAAFLSALIFLIHPLQTSAVTYIVQRSTLLAALSVLLSVLGYLRFRQGKGQGWYIFSLFSAFLGAFCKQTVITIPFIIGLVELYYLPSVSGSPRRWLKVLPYTFLFLLIPVLLLLLKYAAVDFNRLGEVFRQSEMIPRATYFFTEIKVVADYWRLGILPMNLRIDYDIPLVSGLNDPRVFLATSFLAGIAAVAVRWWQRMPWASFGVWWFFLTLLGESSFYPLDDVMFEHRMYLAIAGYAFLTTRLFFCLPERWGRLAAGVLVAGLSFLTVTRNFQWSQTESLLKNNLELSPRKPRPYYQLARWYTEHRQWGPAALVLTQVIPYEIDKSLPICKLAHIHEMAGFRDVAAGLYERGIAENPDGAQAFCYFKRGYLYQQDGQIPKAEEFYEKALQRDPKFTDAAVNLANIRLSQRRGTEAMDLYQQALTGNPFHPEALNGLGWAYVSSGLTAEGITIFSRLIDAEPGQATGYNNLGKSYFMLNNFSEARRNFERAAEVAPREIEPYVNLSNAYIALRSFEQARESLMKAATLARESGQTGLAERLEAKIKKFSGAR